MRGLAASRSSTISQDNLAYIAVFLAQRLLALQSCQAKVDQVGEERPFGAVVVDDTVRNKVAELEGLK